MHDAPLGVTGATGNIGGRVAALVAASGHPQRLIVRDPTRAPSLERAGIAVASYDDPEAVSAALAGLSTVFMVSAAESRERVAQHRCFIDAAVAAGVEHIVYLSFFGAAPDATFTLARDHWATEQHLLASGVACTFVRDNLYADFLPMLAGEDGVIRGPAGNGRVSAVAQCDIAEAVAVILADPYAHRGATYDLTGPEALDLAEVAAIISRATGRSVRFHDETLEEAYASRADYGAPDWQVDAWVSTYQAIAAGEMSGLSSAVQDLTGLPATSLADLLADRG